MPSSSDNSGNNVSSANSNIKTDTVFDLNSSINEIFTKSNAALLIWFLVIYFVLYFLITLFTTPSNSQTVTSSSTSRIGNIMDIIIFLFLILYISATFISSTPDQNQKTVEHLGTNFKTYLEDPYSLLSLFFFICIFKNL